SSERLYLEQYLEQPIEAAIETRLGAPARRDRIVEVGNLACSEPGNARLMFAALCRLLCDNDLDYVVFTGTGKLRNSFHRLHLTPVELAP
ncbi:thermostable hemolysin, partial [Escherichia coli]|nr:thermostable hemolysin [Escherichia coli]